jgi:hypothetical protein
MVLSELAELVAVLLAGPAAVLATILLTALAAQEHLVKVTLGAALEHLLVHMEARVAAGQGPLAVARYLLPQLGLAALVSPIALPERLLITLVVAVGLPMAIQALSPVH